MEKDKTFQERWIATAHAGQQITILQEMRDTGELPVEEFNVEVNKILDALNEL
tara:strand:+ start:3832 stop:3990 length:159 start_codon:yes stop_codon:yes gene_type:complete